MMTAGPDLFICSRRFSQLLLINQHDGTFKDIAGEAVGGIQRARCGKAGMAWMPANANGDGLPDFVVTNFNDQYIRSLWARNRFRTKIELWPRPAALTKSYVGWGVKFSGLRHDGNLDLSSSMDTLTRRSRPRAPM